MWRKTCAWMADRERETAEVARLARRAVELGKDDAVALCKAGHGLAHVVGNYDGAIALIDRALALNPNLVVTMVLQQQLGESLVGRVRGGDRTHDSRYPKPAALDKAFESIPADEDWEWYLSEANTNSFYFSCELAIGYGIMSATGEPLHIGAFGTVMQEVMQTTNTLPYFLMPLMKAILTKHLGEAILNPQPGAVIENAPQLGRFWIPFFAGTQPR